MMGWVTSGGYGRPVGRSLALGYVPVAQAEDVDGFTVELMGERLIPTCIDWNRCGLGITRKLPRGRPRRNDAKIRDRGA